MKWHGWHQYDDNDITVEVARVTPHNLGYYAGGKNHALRLFTTFGEAKAYLDGPSTKLRNLSLVS